MIHFEPITQERWALYKKDICLFLSEQYIVEIGGQYQLIRIEPWQRKLLTDIFHTYDSDGKRLYTEALIGLPRKNYKSSTLSGVAIWSLLFDLKNRAQVLSAAGSKDQAGVIFKETNLAIQQNPQLRSVFTGPQKGYRINTPIVVPKTNSEYYAVSADAMLQHGLKPSLVLFDEIHVQRNHLLWEALQTAMGLRRGKASPQNPLILSITTAGYNLYEGDGKTKTLAYEKFCVGTTLKYKKQLIDEGKLEILKQDKPHFEEEDLQLLNKCKAGNNEAERHIKDDIEKLKRFYFFWSYENLAENYSLEFLEEQKNSLPGRVFQILHENTWIGGSGSLLSDAQVTAVFDRKDLYEQTYGDPTLTYFMGIDMGRIIDRSVIVVLHFDMETREIIVDYMRTWINTKDNPMDFKEAEVVTFDLADKFNIDFLAGTIVYDPHQFLRSAEELSETLPLTEWSPSTKGIQEISKVVYNLCSNKKLKCYGHDMLKSELIGLQEIYKEYGFRIDHPKGGYSDHIIAIGMAAKEAIQESNSQFSKGELGEHKDVGIVHISANEGMKVVID